MSDDDLHELLDELRAAISSADGLEVDDRARLDGLLAQMEAEVDEDEGVIDHIQDAVGRFETEHVDLVAALNRIANVLSAGGL